MSDCESHEWQGEQLAVVRLTSLGLEWIGIAPLYVPIDVCQRCGLLRVAPEKAKDNATLPPSGEALPHTQEPNKPEP